MPRQTPSVIQQRSKSSNKRQALASSPNDSPQEGSGNHKRFRNDYYHHVLLFLNNYYHVKSPLGRLRFLLITMTLFSILTILLFHPPCYRRRAQGMLLCRLSREMGLIAGVPPKETLPPQERARLLLGFMSRGNDNEEKRRRDKIRNTLQNHIGFDGDHTTAVKHVCSLQEYLSNPLDYKFCRVVYTFLFGGNPDGTHLEFNKTYPLLLPYDKTKFTMAEDESSEKNEESDIMVFNVQDANNVRKVFAWYEYTTKIRMERGRKFDYVAFTDTYHSIDVNTFLGNNIFQVRSTIPLTYAGVQLDTSLCTGHNHTYVCPRLLARGDKFMNGFVAVSRDMVDYCLSHSNLIQLDGLYPQDRPDIAIADLFRFHPIDSLNITHLDGITGVSDSVI